MNQQLKNFLHRLLLNKFSWQLLKPIVSVSDRLKAAKHCYDNAPNIKQYRSVAEERLLGNKVLHGPFKGMTYHDLLPTGSSYYAKLLGSYESELHSTIDDLIKNRYDLVVDIGSDEGYYAVGLGLATGAPVIAYDSNKSALAQCKALADLNAIKIDLRGKCDANELLNINYGKKSLVFADCEGDERNIFTAAVAEKLVNADIIIEMHLHIIPEIAAHLSKIFSATHEIIIIDSVDDHLKVMNYKYPELEGLSYKEKYFILEEREYFMQWMVLKTRMKNE